tara:strand:+ start:261 stop:635 length:375 start_codon:yes stop_codon:yes gene_type:complete
MKFTIFTITILTLLVSVNASSYQSGIIAGMVVERVMPNKKEKIIKYNTVNIDTSLFDFPKQKMPVCRPIEVKVVNKKTFLTRVASMVTMGGWIYVACRVFSTDPEFGDFMLGYLAGQAFERILN